MTIRSQLDLNIALNRAYSLDYSKAKPQEISNFRYFLSNTLGGFPAAASAPGATTGAIVDNTTVGFWSFANWGANTNYILGAKFAMENTSTASSASYLNIYIIDILWYNSNMITTVTTDTSLGATATVNRPDGTGAGTELWILQWTGLPVGNQTLSVKYTNQSGTSGQVATWFKAAGSQDGEMGRMTLATGDTGVRSVQSYSWDGSFGAGANFGLAIVRRICDVAIYGGGETTFDWYQLGMPTFYDGAALAIMWGKPPTGGAGNVNGKLLIGNG